jgi:hypothetical protein
MLTLKEFMEIADYRITEGSTYGWKCYGYNAYQLDSWNGVHGQGGYSLCVVFDTKTQVVYEVQAHDYTNYRAYRIINPEYTNAFKNECDDRSVADQAWERDDGTPVAYIDLDVDDDFIQKALAIVAGEDYDTRVSVPVDFSDDDLLKYMTLAHERDITFNQFIEQALRTAIQDHARDPAGFEARAQQFKSSEIDYSFGEEINEAD